MSSTQFILVDGRNMVFRHAHVNDALTREDGFPTGSLYGCLNSMLSLHTRMPEAGIVWCWDGAGDTWRHKYIMTLPKINEPLEDIPDEDTYLEQLVATTFGYFGMQEEPKPKKEKKYGYKANRARPENEKKDKKPKWPETIRERALLQIPVLQLILKGCGIASFEIDKLECDDLLAMVARRIIKLDKDAEIYIHSGDKDYYQLLAWPNVKILKKVKDGKLELVTKDDVIEEYGVKPKHWARYEALAGGHNNVPHLRKVGPAYARQMLEAGIDPSLSSCEAIELEDKFKRFFEPSGIEKMWPSVHGNYKLCKLVTRPDSELLEPIVREKLADLFNSLDKIDMFYRSDNHKTSEWFRKTSMLLDKYELASITARRDVLFDIP